MDERNEIPIGVTRLGWRLTPRTQAPKFARSSAISSLQIGLNWCCLRLVSAVSAVRHKAARGPNAKAPLLAPPRKVEPFPAPVAVPATLVLRHGGQQERARAAWWCRADAPLRDPLRNLASSRAEKYRDVRGQLAGAGTVIATA